MSVALRRSWTRDEFLDWAAGQEDKYEFDGHGPVLVTRGGLAHGRIIINLVRALLPFEDAGWLTYTDIAIGTVDERLRAPDVAVARAGQRTRERILDNPTMVFEVVSPTSAREDRLIKRREYAAVPSIARYVIVESESASVLDLARTDAGWDETPLAVGDELTLPAFPLVIAVSDLYRNTHLYP